MTYTADHASALREIMDAGASVTFTKVDTTYSASDDTHTVTESALGAYAVQIGDDARRYAELSMAVERSITLLVATNTYGDKPEVGSTVSWGGDTYTVRDAAHIAPDGTAIVSRVYCER